MENMSPIGLRDFILTYNKIADKCFNLCVYSMVNREISKDEDMCIHNCTKRFIQSNTRISRGFADYQFKKMADVAKTQEQAQIQAAEEPTITTTTTTPTT